MELTRTVCLSEIGGVSHKMLQEVVTQHRVYILTHYKTDVAYLTWRPLDDEVREACLAITDATPRQRAMKTTIRDAMWKGEVIGVRTGRSSSPMALLIPINAFDDEKSSQGGSPPDG